MKYTIKIPLEIWHDEDMTKGREEVPIGAVVEETRPTRHQRSDAIWIRFNGTHVGHALRDHFEDCAEQADVHPDDDAGQSGGKRYTAVRFLKYTS